MTYDTKHPVSYKNTISACLRAFLAAWAAVRVCRLSTFHLFGGLFFLAFLLLGRSFLSWKETVTITRREKVTSVIISSLFTFLSICADYNGLLGGLTSVLFRLCHILIIAAGLYLIFDMCILSFLIWSRRLSPFCPAASDSTVNAADSGTPRRAADRLYQKLPLVTFFACLLGALPYLITNYPGIMTVDSLNQYGQIIGELPMSNHHPWVHTQLIRLFYEIGLALGGDAVTGLGLFTIFQILVMAGVFAYLTDTFIKLHVKGWICVLTTLFYAVLPYNAIYMVTMWKDILFSGMTLLFSTVVFRFLVLKEMTKREKISACALYLISGFCMCLMRSNGFYAFVLTLPFLLFTFRRQWKRTALLNLVLLAIVLTVKGPVMNAFHVASADFVESLSIPIQLAARVYADGEPVSKEDDEMWNRIVDTSQIPEAYESFCSDHMKNLIRMGNPGYLEAHKADYLKLWLRFGAKHPGAYVRGYIDATKGYWYPDVPNRIGYDDLIAENPYGLTARPLLHNPLTIKIKEIVFKLPDMVPLYGLLFSLGFMFWLCILLAGKVFVHTDRRFLLVFLPNAAIMATLFAATPVYNEFRYAYSMLLTVPLFILCAFFRTER
ncbi:MAG: hypothetical protein J6C33_08540 [Lachnospiraceae bacterium]|nr:hypothetical protein [Lachnospiraceae bacterium]